jgi:hypothetical protein
MTKGMKRREEEHAKEELQDKQNGCLFRDRDREANKLMQIKLGFVTI